MRTEGKRERRLVWVAILASLFLHVVIAFSVAAFSNVSTPLPPPDDQPVQLTMVDLPPNPVNTPKPNPAYVENDPTKETAEPKEKIFESNANSQAASDKPASGDLPVPTQDGREQPFLDLQNQQAAIAMQGKKAQPTPPPEPSVAPTATPRASEPPKPTPTATPVATPAPLATPEPEKFAMLTSTPPPALRDTDETTPTPTPPDLPPTPPPPVERPRPESPASAYQREQQQTRITGRLTNRGPSSVNAVATPLGKYQKLVSDAVGSRWYYYVKQRMDLVSVGTAHLEAQVDSSGKIRNLRILSNTSNESFANICLQSFQEAQIPPIPPDLVATLPDGRLPVDFYFT
ncbi:MAG TPA: hypothetical protein VGC85_03215, partial [Chthoniobacterales bacterium]